MANMVALQGKLVNDQANGLGSVAVSVKAVTQDVTPATGGTVGAQVANGALTTGTQGDYGNTVLFNEAVSHVAVSTVSGRTRYVYGNSKVQFAGVAITQESRTNTTVIPALNIFSTWNEATTAHLGLRMNITNTASHADARLVDLKVGGTTKFAIDVNGDIKTVGVITSPVLTTPQINDTSADHQYIFAVSELAADRTVTLPLLLGNDEFVFKDFTQILTNKTLTSPTIGTGATFSFLTQGSVLFAGAAGALTQDNAKLFWDNTNNFLGIGTASPGNEIHAVGTVRIDNTNTDLLYLNGARAAGTTGIAWLGGVGGEDFRIRKVAGAPTLEFEAAGGPAVRMTIYNGGVTIGAPTGGDQGAGTLNVDADVYKDGSAYNNPDYALEHWATGTIKDFIQSPGADSYPGLMALDKVELFAREYKHLPRISREPSGMFERADMLLEKIEEIYLYLFDFEKRLRQLEARPYHEDG